MYSKCFGCPFHGYYDECSDTRAALCYAFLDIADIPDETIDALILSDYTKYRREYYEYLEQTGDGREDLDYELSYRKVRLL